MGKIVAILASPRQKGNSFSIVDSILDGAMGLSTKVIKLHRLDSLRSFHGCRACMGCKPSCTCVQQDDVSDIMDDMRDADCVIFSSPVYFGSVNAQYKILEDRMYSFIGPDGRKAMAGKKAIVVTTLGEHVEMGKPVADHISHVLEAVGFDVIEKIVYSDEGGKSPASEDLELMKKMKALGLNFRNT
ncbi:MAG: flavodoxin family protein [Candidatus Methanomethylophilaceae archaeon]|nr:flavodoxin family protein [Candidatus Methanomethylophilaceae archaeon]